MKVLDLTPRLEAEVKAFANVLNLAPAEVIMGVFESPAPKSALPRHWVDSRALPRLETSNAATAAKRRGR